MTRQEQLLNELRELNEEGMNKNLVRRYESKEWVEVEEIENYIKFYKIARTKLRELYKITGDDEVFDKLDRVNDLIKQLDALYIYKTMGHDFYTPTVEII